MIPLPLVLLFQTGRIVVTECGLFFYSKMNSLLTHSIPVFLPLNQSLDTTFQSTTSSEERLWKVCHDSHLLLITFKGNVGVILYFSFSQQIPQEHLNQHCMSPSHNMFWLTNLPTCLWHLAPSPLVLDEDVNLFKWVTNILFDLKT